MGKKSKTTTSTKRPERYSRTSAEQVHGYGKKRRSKLQTTNTNSGLSLIYIRDWNFESIGVIKKVLRTEIGQETGGPAIHNSQHHRKDPWPDVDTVRHINQYVSPSTPLMEVAYTPDKTDMVREFFECQGVKVCDAEINACINRLYWKQTRRTKRSWPEN